MLPRNQPDGIHIAFDDHRLVTSPGSLSIFTCYSQNSWESIGISTIR